MLNATANAVTPAVSAVSMSAALSVDTELIGLMMLSTWYRVVNMHIACMAGSLPLVKNAPLVNNNCKQQQETLEQQQNEAGRPDILRH